MKKYLLLSFALLLLIGGGCASIEYNEDVYNEDINEDADGSEESEEREIPPNYEEEKTETTEANQEEDLEEEVGLIEEVELIEETELNDDSSEAASISFDVSGKNFEFSQTEVRVKKGDSVTINFTSEDGLHDWVVEGISDAKTDRVRTGESTSVTFVASETGEFEYFCSVGSHRAAGMIGRLIVE